MRHITITLAILALCGCAPSLVPVPGAPEVHAEEGNAAMTVLPDGSRYVVINVGESVFATVILPPIKNVEK